jgi:branched-chain amino acid aminotransferase
MNEMWPVWLNGRLVSAADLVISASDRGFTLADGVFETIRAHGIQPLWLHDHLARFRQSASVFGIPVPLSNDAIADGLIDLLKASAHRQSALRLTLSRGPSEKRGLWPPSLPTTPTLVASVAKLPAPSAPLRLLTAKDTRRNEHSPLARIKSLNYGDNLLARREVIARGVDDALMLNTTGRAACATVANLFLRIGGRWCTPPVSDGALPGLARKRLLRMLDAGETTISSLDVGNASAGFLSNSLAVSPIREIDGQRLDDTGTLLEKMCLFDSE